MRNIETFPSKQMYPYLSLVERKVAEFYHNIDRRRWLVWVQMTYFHSFFRTIHGVLAVTDYTLQKAPSPASFALGPYKRMVLCKHGWILFSNCSSAPISSRIGQKKSQVGLMIKCNWVLKSDSWNLYPMIHFWTLQSQFIYISIYIDYSVVVVY